MRTKWLAVLLIGGLLACGVSWQAAVNADLQADRSAAPTTEAKSDVEMETDCWGGWLGDKVFAKRIAGTYFIEFELYTGTLYGIVQTNADGAVWHHDQSDFGLAGFSDLNSPVMGSWKRTGRRQVTTARLGLIFDNPHETLPTLVARVRDVVDWDEGWDTASGLAFRRVYDLSLGEDPLDPEDGTPLETVPVTLTRIVP